MRVSPCRKGQNRNLPSIGVRLDSISFYPNHPGIILPVGPVFQIRNAYLYSVAGDSHLV